MTQFNFNIGADPEFLLFHKEKLINAQSIMLKTLGNNSDFQDEDMGYSKTDEGSGIIGWDGNNATGELRPEQNETPKNLVKNLGNLIKSIHQNIPNITMTTMSIGRPVGGHIHLEIPAEHENMENYFRNNNPEAGKIKRVLTNFLLPIIASEDPINVHLRMTNGAQYGRIDDVRFQSEFHTLEVRALTAEWITTPEIAEATLTYMGVIWNQILKYGHNIVGANKAMPQNQKQQSALHTLLLTEFKPVRDITVKRMHDYVKTFDLYPENKDKIDLIFNTKKMIKLKDKAGKNVTRGWGYHSEKIKTKPQKRSFLSKKQLQKMSLKKDLDENETINPNIRYNDDHNMAFFMEELSKRLTVYDMELNKSYFFFGVKKGVNDFLIVETSKKENKYISVPTNISTKEISVTTQRMNERVEKIPEPNRFSINPETGKPSVGKNKKTILFGIPYDVRIKEDMRTFLSKLWDVDNKKNIKTVTMKEIPEPKASELLKEKEEEEIDENISQSVEADEITITVPNYKTICAD